MILSFVSSLFPLFPPVQDSRLFAAEHRLRLLEMRQRIEHHIRGEEERGKEGRKSEGIGMGEWLRCPGTDASVKRYRLDQYVPTVEAQEASEINAEPAQARHPGDEAPTRQAPHHAHHHRLHKI